MSANVGLLLLSSSAFGQAATTPDGAKDTTPLGAAAQAAGRGATTPDATSAGSGGLVRTIVSLIIVVAVIYGLTWVLRQAKAAQKPEDLGHGLLATATLSLGGARSVQLVRAGDELLLLGVTDDGISLLRTYTEAEAAAAGFPTGGDGDETFTPIGKDAAPSGLGPQLVDRVRQLTVRR